MAFTSSWSYFHYQKGGKMNIAIVTATILTLAVPAWAGGNVQLRSTHEKPGPNSDQLEIVHRDPAAAPLKELVFVDQKALVDPGDIISAEAAPTADGTPRIELSLTDSGARVLRHDRGRHVALVVDGQALVTGEITPADRPGKIDLSGDFTKGEAQRAVDQINEATARR
jgi:hypothetical protein